MRGLNGKAAPGLRRLGMLAGVALAVSSSLAMAQATVATGVGTPFELAFWQSIDSSSDASLYEAYLARYPNGTFGEIARAKIVALHGRVASAPVAAQAVSPALTVPVAATPAMTPAMPSPLPAVAAVSPMPAAAPQPAAYAPVASPAVTAPDPAPVVAPATTMGQLLAALASSQTNGHAGGNPGAATPVATAAVYHPPAQPTSAQPTSARITLPAQPVLSPVPNLTLPASFCSADARNAFHASVYVPTVNIAKANNEAAAGYMRQLQSLYDQYQLSHDPDTMNAIVAAARNYQQVAETTFSMQAGLVRQFNALMAVPLAPCALPTQPPALALIK